MKKRFVFLTLLVNIAFSSVAFTQNVKVTFLNKTGFDIDSLVFQEHYLGVLKKNGTTKPLFVDSIRVDGNVPSEYIYGIIRGKNKYVGIRPGYCMVGVNTSWEGEYLFDIILSPVYDYNLLLEKHNEQN